MEILLVIIIMIAIGGLVWTMFAKQIDKMLAPSYPPVYRSVLEEDKYLDWTGPHQTFVAKPRWTNLDHLEVKDVPSQADIVAGVRRR